MKGRYLYLGWFFNHYGHFILESLARCWAIDEAGEVDGYLFHLHAPGNRAATSLLIFLELLGIPRQKILFLTTPCRAEELLLPTQQAVLSRKISDDTLSLYRKIGQAAWRNAGKPRGHASIYLSRRFLQGKMRRAVNEFSLEQHFGQRGYRIVHPQLMNISDQLALYYRARNFAGLEGSALHNILFAEAPRELWVLGTNIRMEDTITQTAINQWIGCPATLVLQPAAPTACIDPMPLLIRPSRYVGVRPVSAFDRFCWLEQLATHLGSENACDVTDAANELGLDHDEYLILDALCSMEERGAALRKLPDDAELKAFLLMAVHAHRGEQEQAIGQIMPLWAQYKHHPEFLLRLGTMLHRAGHYRKALETTAGALALEPENPSLALLKADLLATTQEPEAAYQLLVELLERYPCFPAARIKLAELLAARERFAEAAAELGGLLRESPGRHGLWPRLTWYHFRAGQLDEAREAALEALRRTPHNPFSRVHLARIHLRLGDLKAAMHWIDEAIVQSPEKAELHRLKEQISRNLRE